MPDLLERLRFALADRYAVESEIGRGGMAKVFLAEDLKHHRKVAIKVLHPELAIAVGPDRFLREIETVAGLTHPHILTLIDSGEADGLLYYIMPYVEGESLRQRLEREKQLPVDEATRIAEEVADALDHAHRHGVVHRDIKPGNILLEEGHAAVTDFGVARAISEAGGEKVTATGMTVGTPAYMSPEQAAGQESDERSDLYALGCVLYEMLAGEAPLTGTTPQSTAAKRLTGRPTPLGAMRSTVPGRLESLVEKTLAISSADRPATARQLAEQLAEVRRSPEPAARSSPGARWLVPVIGLAVIVGMAAILWLLATDRPVTRHTELLPVGVEDLGVYSLAVLPLANNTGADSLDWLGPGLANMLTTDLAQIEELRVVSAQRLLDLMRQAGREATEHIPEDLALSVAARSGARTLVYGSFVRLGEDIRLDVQLIDLSNGTVTGAEQERGPDVFTLVDAVSARLSTRVLGEAITPTELTPISQLSTGSLDAYREYQEGLLAERRFLYEQAGSRYEQAVQLDSTFAIAWLRLALAADQARHKIEAYSKAERYKEKASERDRHMIEAMLAVQLGGDVEEAERLLQEMIARYPEDKEARFQLGMLYDEQGQADEGRPVLEEAVRLDPSYAPAVNRLAYMAGRLGDEVGADTLSLRYVELEPDLANPHDSRGEILEMVGRHEEARAEFREALRIDPGFIVSYWHIVRSYLRESDPRGARAALEPYMDVEDPAASVWMRRLEGDTYLAEGRYRDGLAANRRAAEKAAELGRDGWVTWHGFALYSLLEWAALARHTGAYDEAARAYAGAEAIDALNWSVLNGRIRIYGAQRRVDEMLAVRDSYSAATRFDAEPAMPRQMAELRLRLADGMIAFYTQDFETTVRLFDEGRELAGAPRPNPIPGPVEESLALIEVGRASEALDLAETWLERTQNNDRFIPLRLHLALYLRGRAYEALGDHEQALKSYERLLELVGDGIRETPAMDDASDRLARLKGESSRTSVP